MWLYNSSLSHVGVKGMRWGKHKVRSEAEQSARSKIKETQRTLKKAKQTYNNFQTNANRRNVKKATSDHQHAKDDLSDVKATEKMATQTKKSNRQLKLEEKYLSSGMTKSDAELAAFKRARTERALAIAGGVTIAAAATYGAYKYKQYAMDSFIKSGTTMQNISTDNEHSISNKGIKDAFYASYNKTDNTKYRGLYGGGQLGGMEGKKIRETKVNVTEHLKVASPKSTKSTIAEILKTDEAYKDTVNDELRRWRSQTTGTQNKIMNKAIADMQAGKYNSHNVSNAVNLMLTNHDTEDARQVSSKLYDSLKTKGYDAINDVNDRKYSGYNAKTPTIVFNGAKTKIDQVRDVGIDELTKDHSKAVGNLILTSAAKTYAKYGMAAAGIIGIQSAATTASVRREDNKKIAAYRKAHPDSQLSNKQIVRGGV